MFSKLSAVFKSAASPVLSPVTDELTAHLVCRYYSQCVISLLAHIILLTDFEIGSLLPSLFSLSSTALPRASSSLYSIPSTRSLWGL